MTRGKLKIVGVEPEPVDIHAQALAEIRARDWGAVHVAAERRPALDIQSPPHKRTWTTWRR